MLHYAGIQCNAVNHLVAAGLYPLVKIDGSVSKQSRDETFPVVLFVYHAQERSHCHILDSFGIM